MFKIIHSLLRVDSNQEEKGENLVNILLPDEALGVESVYKLIPKLIVELIGSSKREGYTECIYHTLHNRYATIIETILTFRFNHVCLQFLDMGWFSIQDVEIVGSQLHLQIP